MRYILIDPYAKTVTEGVDPRLDVKGDNSRSHLHALRELLNCGTVEWVSMAGVTPRHDILLDEIAGIEKPQPPTFVIGDVHLIGRAVILGLRGRNSTACSLPLERVQKSVRFDAGPKVMRQPVIRSYASVEQMMANQAKQPVVRWLLG
jgi:hypothetical protein